MLALNNLEVYEVGLQSSLTPILLLLMYIWLTQVDVKMAHHYTNSGSTYIILEHRIMLKLCLDASEKLSMFTSKGGKCQQQKSLPHSYFVALFNINKGKNQIWELDLL